MEEYDCLTVDYVEVHEIPPRFCEADQYNNDMNNMKNNK